jgi:GxxExxY protein
MNTNEHESGTNRVDLLCKEEVFQIVGAGFEVYNQLGCGFLEAVYQEALQREFELRNISCVPQARLSIQYKGALLEKVYLADFICFGCVIVEIKCVERLTTIDEAQVLNYLKATGLRVAVLLNFQPPHGLEWKRYVR